MTSVIVSLPTSSYILLYGAFGSNTESIVNTVDSGIKTTVFSSGYKQQSVPRSFLVNSTSILFNGRKRANTLVFTHFSLFCNVYCKIKVDDDLESPLGY